MYKLDKAKTQVQLLGREVCEVVVRLDDSRNLAVTEQSLTEVWCGVVRATMLIAEAVIGRSYEAEEATSDRLGDTTTESSER